MDVGRDLLAGECLELVPGQRERAVHEAEDAEVPRAEIGIRDRPVVEDRELVGLVLAGRDAGGDGRVGLLAHQAVEHGGLRCAVVLASSHTGVELDSVASASDGRSGQALPFTGDSPRSPPRMTAPRPETASSSATIGPIDPRVIIVMPAYNAAKTLERTYADIPHEVVDRIILVDDVSKDATVDVARQLGLDVIIHRQNRGYGGNQKTCYDAALAAGADIVVMLHPDYQYDATRIPELDRPDRQRRARPDARQPLPRRPARRRACRAGSTSAIGS